MGKNLEILNKLSVGESRWLSEAKKRERFSLWYDFKFNIVLKWLMLKNKIKNI